MSGIEGKFNVLIPRDNSDILKEDLEKQSNAIHDAIGNSVDDMHMEFSGPDKSDVNGIVYGMEVSFDAGVISVSKGVVYNRGRRGAFTSIQTADIGDVAVDDYLVARIVVTETDPRTNPVTHVNEDTFIEFTCELVVTDTPTDDDTVLTKIFNIDAGVPVFGDRASWVYSFGGSSLSIYPVDGSSVDVRGNAGNKYFVRFKVLPNVPVSVEKIEDVSELGFVYLNIILEGDETGVVVTTLEELSDAINLTPQWFRSEWSGTGTDVPTLLPNLFQNYSQFTGGNDYRKYYEVTTGSFALSQIPKFNTSDPFTKHIGFKGSGIPTVNNPHGLTLGDIGAAELSTEAHIKREHYDRASIPRSVSSEFLQVSLPSVITLQVQKSLSDSDVALIAGRVLKVNSVLSVTSPSLTFDLNEIYVNLAGRINRRVVATYDSSTAPSGYSPIQNGAACVLSIIDKQKHLTGDKELYLTVSGGDTVFEAKLGTAGEVVDVSLEGEYLLQDLTDNSWIRIYRESEVLADGSYGNTVTFTSFSDDNELPVCLAWWRGSSWGYAGGSSLTTDLRSYGTMSMNNERYLDLANTIPLEFRPVAGFTNYEAASLDLVINPFEIKYRGYQYKKTAPSTITFPDSAVSFLCVSFDERLSMTLSVVSVSSYVDVSDRVVIARVTTDADEITEVKEAYYPGSYNVSDAFREFYVSSSQDLLFTLQSINMFEALSFPCVIHLMESISINSSDLSSIIAENVVLDGHNNLLSIAFDSEGYISCEELLIKNCNIYHESIVFYAERFRAVNSVITGPSATVPSVCLASTQCLIDSCIVENSGFIAEYDKGLFIKGSILREDVLLNKLGAGGLGQSNIFISDSVVEASLIVDEEAVVNVYSSRLASTDLFKTAVNVSLNLYGCVFTSASLVLNWSQTKNVCLYVSGMVIDSFLFEISSAYLSAHFDNVVFNNSAISFAGSSTGSSIRNSVTFSRCRVSADGSNPYVTDGFVFCDTIGSNTFTAIFDACFFVTDWYTNFSLGVSSLFLNNCSGHLRQVFADDIFVSNCDIFSISNDNTGLFDNVCFISKTLKVSASKVQDSSHFYKPASGATDVVLTGSYFKPSLSLFEVIDSDIKVSVSSCFIDVSSGYLAALIENAFFTGCFIVCPEDQDVFYSGAPSSSIPVPVTFSDCKVVNFSIEYAAGSRQELVFNNCFLDEFFVKASFGGSNTVLNVYILNSFVKRTYRDDSWTRLFLVEVYGSVADFDTDSLTFNFLNSQAVLDVSDIDGDTTAFYGGGILGTFSDLDDIPYTGKALYTDVCIKNSKMSAIGSYDLLFPSFNSSQPALISLLSTLGSDDPAGVVGFGGKGVIVSGVEIFSQSETVNVCSVINGMEYNYQSYGLRFDVDEQIYPVKPNMVFKDITLIGGQVAFLSFIVYTMLSTDPFPLTQRGYKYFPEILVDSVIHNSPQGALIIEAKTEGRGGVEGLISSLRVINCSAYGLQISGLVNIFDIFIQGCCNPKLSDFGFLDYTVLRVYNCVLNRIETHLVNLSGYTASEFAYIVVSDCVFSGLDDGGINPPYYIIHDPNDGSGLTKKYIKNCIRLTDTAVNIIATDTTTTVMGDLT